MNIKETMVNLHSGILSSFFSDVYKDYWKMCMRCDTKEAVSYNFYCTYYLIINFFKSMHIKKINKNVISGS